MHFSLRPKVTRLKCMEPKNEPVKMCRELKALLEISGGKKYPPENSTLGTIHKTTVTRSVASGIRNTPALPLNSKDGSSVVAAKKGILIENRAITTDNSNEQRSLNSKGTT